MRDATPLSHLRDPSTFAPPPKRVDSGLLPPPALPSSSSSSSYSQPSASLPDHYQQQYGRQQLEYGVAEDTATPPRPYRANTTGLSTANLPPPPRRRDGTDGEGLVVSPPPPYNSIAGVTAGKPPPPSLPPRLPPRQGSIPPSVSPRLPNPEAPSRQTGFLNQGAVDRLGAAGLSVPGFGIRGGGSKPAVPPPRSTDASPRPGSAISPPPSSSVSDLETRLSKFGVGRISSNEGTASPQSRPPSQGTTWAQKQAALKTMSDFKKSPSSVSFSDARSAASTANNFRQRHGEQISAGASKANSLDQKYGVSGKIQQQLGNSNSGAGENATTAGTSHAIRAQSHLDNIGAAAGLLGKKKPPPPPPPKRKPELGSGGSATTMNEPPPIPMSTRPF